MTRTKDRKQKRFDLIEIFKESHEWISAVNGFVITAAAAVNKLY